MRSSNNNNKYFCNHCKDKNYLIECACSPECNDIIVRYDKWGRLRRIKNNHRYRRDRNPFWKDKPNDSNEYRLIYAPNHHRANKKGKIKRHRWVYEQYYNCCLLLWTHIHHINGIKTDNRIENLLPMFKSEHMSITNKDRIKKKKDRTKTFCSICGSNKTKYSKDSNGRYYEHWYGNEIDGWKCKKCFDRIYISEWKRRKKLLNIASKRV